MEGEESTPFTRQPIRPVEMPVDEFTTITIYFSIGWSVFVCVQFLQQVMIPVAAISATFCVYLYFEWTSQGVVERILKTSEFVSQRPSYSMLRTAGLMVVAALGHMFNRYRFSGDVTFHGTYSSAFLVTVLVFQVGACVKYVLLRLGLLSRHHVRRGILGLYCRLLIVVRTLMLVPVWKRYFCQPSCTYSFVFYLIIKVPELFWMFWEFVGSVSDYRNSIYNSMRLANDEEIHDDCPVCQDPPVEGIVLPCGHIGCYECVCAWLRVRHTCPECRSKVVGTRLIEFSDGFIPISIMFYCF